MRHQKKRHKLGRTASHRKATLAALGNSLITHKRITTTVPKAKALRGFIEPLITRAKEDTTHNRRQVFRRLQDNRAVSTLFDEVSEQVGDRPGGYTRVVKLGRRSGDGAPLAMIELVDYNDVQPETSGGEKKRRTRRGGGSGRRRGRSKGATTTEAKQTATASATTKQVDTKSKGVDSEPIEEPVSEDQATPVTERTDAGEVPEEQVEAAEETVKAQKSEAGEAEASADSSDAEAAETDASDDETEPAEASADQAEDSAESGNDTDDESAADETKKNE